MIIKTTIRNKYFKIVITMAASIACMSMTNINHYDLLSAEDQEMEAQDQDITPALSSGLHATNQWESFNTWQCFSTESIQPECSELDYGALHVPTLRMSAGTTLYDFSLDPEPDLDCEQTLAKWVALLENQRSFCVYAAYLQKYPDNPFESDGFEEWHLWIVDQIKTYNGYWKWNDSEAESPTD
ncbi:MAG: hypothetical protein ABL927_01555 [Bdellovibrionales bacterium]